MSTLLVASAGGHLAELYALVDRLQPPVHERTWVTYDRADARALLAGEDVVGGHGPSTRHAGNAIRNARLAWCLLRSRSFDRVISTGAGISVPFLVVARLLGISAHYIESSTRLDEPSLSGRMLQLVPGVRLYTQSASADDRRWTYAGSVYEGFRAERTEPPDRPLRLFVAVGSHEFRFDALMHRMSVLVQPGEHIAWQLGVTTANGLPGETNAIVTPRRLADMCATADVVVCHAGVGLAQVALNAGRCPVLVPRRAGRGEHVDDHQVQLAEHLANLGLAIHAEIENLDREDLRRASHVHIVHERPGPFRLQG